MEVVPAFGLALLAAWLLFAASTKLVSREASVQSLMSLGFPTARADRLWLAVPATESAVAIAVLLFPGAWGAWLALVALFGTFAAAGARSLATGATVPCNCFGGYGRERRLGWPQVIQFVPVAGLVFWAAASWQGSPWTVAQGAALVGGCTAIGASIHLVLARPSWTRVRADRLSRQETSIGQKRIASELATNG